MMNTDTISLLSVSMGQINRVSDPMINTLRAITNMDQPQKNFDLYKFGQFYIHRHRYNQC